MDLFRGVSEEENNFLRSIAKYVVCHLFAVRFPVVSFNYFKKCPRQLNCRLVYFQCINVFSLEFFHRNTRDVVVNH